MGVKDGRMPYYNRYPMDYAMDTAHLSFMEHGAYNKLMDRYYLDGWLTSDFERLCNMCSARDEQERKSLERVLQHFFTLSGDRYTHKRIEQELADYKSLKEKKSKGGKASAAKRNSTRVKETSTNQNQNQNQKHNQKSPLPRASHSVSDDFGDSAKHKSKTTTLSTVVKDDTSAKVWEAYALAYARRYGVEPVRNARVNGQIAQFCKRVPADEAPAIASFYLRHSGMAYVRSKHAVGLLLQDAEGLRTEWASGRAVTHAEASQADRTQGNVNVFQKLIDESKADAVADIEKVVEG